MIELKVKRSMLKNKIKKTKKLLKSKFFYKQFCRKSFKFQDQKDSLTDQSDLVEFRASPTILFKVPMEKRLAPFLEG